MQVTSYYFRAHVYTMVPHQIREDMQWMADHGTDAVAVAVLEQDLDAAVENLAIIAAEAKRAGMGFWVVPSRWGGLVAGSPKVPSTWCVQHPETWITDDDDAPQIGWLGPVCSIHHPAVEDWFHTMLARVCDLWPVDGIIWDEPKTLTTIDRSPLARAAGAPADDHRWHLQAVCGFFDRLGAHLAEIAPDCTRAIFGYGHFAERRSEVVTALNGIAAVDDVGLDGRPWPLGAVGDGRQENAKSLIDHGPAFIAAAQAAGKRALGLIENHNTTNAALPLIERWVETLPGMGFEHLLYYYYPRSVEDPERQMTILGQALVAMREHGSR